MEVQYKDFKGTEMLDIKMPSPARQEHKKPAYDREKAENKAVPSGEKDSGKKAIFFLWATVVIILSGAAWYYLLKFLLKF